MIWSFGIAVWRNESGWVARTHQIARFMGIEQEIVLRLTLNWRQQLEAGELKVQLFEI